MSRALDLSYLQVPHVGFEPTISRMSTVRSPAELTGQVAGRMGNEPMPDPELEPVLVLG